MTDDLSNAQIALLCEMGELDPSKLDSDQARDLQRLLRDGYVEAVQRLASPFRLTPKAADFLGKPGVGLNEA